MSSVNINSISILGCGWLGLPLGKSLVDKGYSVKGSVRDINQLKLLNKSGIESYYLNINPYVIGKGVNSFLSSQVLIINFPPGRRDDIEQYHKSQFENLIAEIKLSTISKVIFVSSTSVYPSLNREVVEEDAVSPEKSSGRALLTVEKMLLDSENFETVVLRFGGLIGYDRMPGRFLSGRKKLTGGSSPVNLIHQDDCIGVIEKVLETDVWGEVFNACADIHPKRKDYYVEQAKIGGFDPPEFVENGDSPYKIINSDKLKRLTGYEFIHPDPTAIKES